jgi:hypothetical protein
VRFTSFRRVGINVRIYVGDDEPHNQWSDDNVHFVGPRRSARITYIDLSAEIKAVITWHLLEDCSDEQQPPQIITW